MLERPGFEREHSYEFSKRNHHEKTFITRWADACFAVSGWWWRGREHNALFPWTTLKQNKKSLQLFIYQLCFVKTYFFIFCKIDSNSTQLNLFRVVVFFKKKNLFCIKSPKYLNIFNFAFLSLHMFVISVGTLGGALVSRLCRKEID